MHIPSGATTTRSTSQYGRFDIFLAPHIVTAMIT